jgi:hypothetical protein
MINSLNFSLFPSDEFYTFSNGAVTIVEEKKDQTPALLPFIDNSTQLVVSYQSALERERKNPFTLLLAEKDAVRDSAFMAFRTYTEAAGYRNMEGWHNAASKVLEVIRRHGWSAASMGYKAETAALEGAISELKLKCADEISLMGSTEWLDEVDAAQKDFADVAHQSVINAPIGVPTLIDVRPALTQSLRALFSMISLLQSNTPSDALKAIETALNELIIRSLSTVKAADTRAGNQKKAVAAPTT